MKKIFFILFFIGIIRSQDFEPSQLKFYFKDLQDSILINSSQSRFLQNKFLKGWHWDSKKKINESLKMNQVDIYDGNNLDTFQNNAMLVIKSWELYSHANDNKLLNARSIQYSPALKIDKNNPEKLVIKQDDKKKEIFGFMHILGDTVSDSNSELYNSLLISGNKVNTLKDSIILSDPWPSNILNIASDITENNTINNFLCQTLYISINLKKLDNGQLNDSNVLKIELPYNLGLSNTTKHIQFDSIPSNGPNDTINSNRGIYRKLINTTGDTVFYIKRNMLPSNDSNVTISAFFIMDGDLFENNYKLKNGDPISTKIDSLKIKVTYLGNAEIAINWLRFETPHAQKYFRGEYDENIKYEIQSLINKFTDPNYNITNPGSRIFRFNTIVEGSLFNWQAERYFNKLVGNIGTSEVVPIYPEHYERYVNGK